MWIEGDGGQLTRMFVNVIKNAADALDGKGREIALTLEASAEHAVVRLRDEGRGMPPEVSVLGRRLRYTSDVETSPLWLIAIDRWIAKANREMGRSGVPGRFS